MRGEEGSKGCTRREALGSQAHREVPDEHRSSGGAARPRRGATLCWSWMTSNDLDLAVRHRVYTAMAASGRAPTAARLSLELGAELGEVRTSLERLDEGHALVLDAVTREVRLALPFSNISTPYRVESGGRGWDANCAWDSLALVRLLGLRDAQVLDRGGPGRDGRVLTVAVGNLAERDGVISSARPAWRWWEDIVFT